ncbi:cell wall protein RBR3 [Brassica rapa]|uniref:Uncharacterized protein n=1 Tax=Brassica campestris TaxID=3711 RepID=M4ETH5_BRACM|nr:cell wall protein RBR3 [Brassica rapa]
MAENVGSGESEFGSVTSSQVSFLKNCPFADPLAGVEEDTDSDGTEVLGTPISPPVTRTPILSLSTPISLDSINDEDVFRTPPENASLSSSAAGSEPRARASELKPRRRGGGGSKSKSKSKSPPTTPVSASASLAVKNVRVLETNRIADDPEEPVTVTDVTPLTSPPSFAAGNVKAPGGGASKLKSPSRVSASPSLTEVPPLSSPSSFAAADVRVTRSHFDSKSPSPPTVSAGDVRVPGKQPDLDSSSPESAAAIDDYEIEIPFKEVIEALLRNNGENLDDRDERVSYVEILKRFGLKFP